MRVSGTAVRRWVVAALAVLTAVTGVAAVPAAAAAPPIGEAPFISNVVDASTRVRVGYKDRSYAEDAFQLLRRGLTGSWEYVVEAPTRDKTQARFQGELVDPTPNALRCYLVVAYDNAGGVNLWSREQCVDGGSDPFDASRTGLPAPRVNAVQGQWSPTVIQVRINYVDRSLNESRFEVVRRQDGHESAVGQAATTSRTSVGQYGAFFDTLPPGGNACYTVRAVDDVTGSSSLSNEVCLTPPAALPTPPAGSLSVEQAYSGPKPNVSFTGETSLAIGADGLPIMAFRGRVPGSSKVKVMVAHCDDRVCSSSTATALEDEVFLPSIAIGGDGLPVISYRSFAHGLRVAHCTNLRCTSATFATVDEVGFFDLRALAMTVGPDGYPTIAYQDQLRRTNAPGSATKVAHCLDYGCTRATITTIGAASHGSGQATVTSKYLAIAISPLTRRTYVAYIDGETVFSRGNRTVLKVAACLDPACTTSTTSTVDREVDGSPQPGIGLSMAVGRDGLPLLSYDWDTGLLVAHCVNIHCSGITTKFYDALTDGRDTVSNTSLAIGADGLGVVSYHNPSTSRLEFVHCTNLACSNGSISAVRTETPVDWAPSVAIGADGLPVVGVGADILTLFHCQNAACSDGTPPGPAGPLEGGGKCAEVLLASTDNGTPIQLRPCSHHIAQRWTVIGDGTLQALGKCLNIAGATADGTPIQLHDCNGHWTQIWERQASGALRNPWSGKCLDTALHSDVDFIRLVLWQCTPGISSQVWRVPR
jgi:hypothetical protein